MGNLILQPRLEISSPGARLDPINAQLNELLETDPADIGQNDVAHLNLLCAPGLPGCAKLDIPRCLARLDTLAAFVRAAAERNLYRQRTDVQYHHSEPMWRMAMLVTNLKLDFGAAYDPAVKADLEGGGCSHFTDARNVFIHGLLADDPGRRWGSCSSIPVLVAAVGRRLGYPVKLAVTQRHVYARWDDEKGTSFNVEASNSAGMASPPDDHYRNLHGPMTAEDERSGFYVRALSAAEEFALFLKARVWCLHDVGRYAETLLWSARALQFAADDPHFAQVAYAIADIAIKHRYRQKYPAWAIPGPESGDQTRFNLGELLTLEERSLFLTIVAHHAESLGELDRARKAYEDACRQNFHGHNEQRDLQRFLHKHGLRSRPGRVLPPEGNIGQPRRMKLNCSPDQEAAELRRLAIQFEREGDLLKARDTLHDLYLFDPCDPKIFHRARALEQQPQLQEQLRTLIAERRLAIRGAPESNWKLTGDKKRSI